MNNRGLTPELKQELAKAMGLPSAEDVGNVTHVLCKNSVGTMNLTEGQVYEVVRWHPGIFAGRPHVIVKGDYGVVVGALASRFEPAINV